MQTKPRSFQLLQWRLASVAIGLVVTLGFSGCPRTVPPEGLLLAYQSKTGATGIPSIRVMVSIPTAGAMWTESTPWNGTAFPEGDVPTGGVGAANDANSIGRLVGWVAGGAKTRMRYGLGSNWEAAIGERAHDFDENALDSAPAIARHSEAAWLVAQKVNQQSKIYLYVPNGQLFQDQDLQDQTFTAFSRNHPVIATSGNRFVVADTLLGGTGTPSVQIVSGKLTATGIANSQRLNPVFCVPPSCPSVVPIVTGEIVNTDGSRIHHVAVDVAVSEDGRGGFLLAVLEMPAQPDSTPNQALMPINGENVTLKVVRTSAETFTRSDGFSIWSSLALQNNLPAGSAQFIQCVPFPGAADSVLVLTVGPAGRTGWKISPSGASTTAVTPLSPAALATIFSSAAPASQPFALIRTGHSSAN